jgi:hypothetical protein
MNRRTLLTTTTLALAPYLPNRTPDRPTTHDTPEWVSLPDYLPGADWLPGDWHPETQPSAPVGATRDDQDSTVLGSRTQTPPTTEARVSSRYAKRRFVTGSNLPDEFENIEVTVEMAETNEHTSHDTVTAAVPSLHEAIFADETDSWESLSTGWVDARVRAATDLTREQSVASIQKPLCACPPEIELSTERPVIELAVVVSPLPWGVATVTATVADPDEVGYGREISRRVAARTTTLTRWRQEQTEDQ